MVVVVDDHLEPPISIITMTMTIITIITMIITTITITIKVTASSRSCPGRRKALPRRARKKEVIREAPAKETLRSYFYWWSGKRNIEIVVVDVHFLSKCWPAPMARPGRPGLQEFQEASVQKRLPCKILYIDLIFFTARSIVMSDSPSSVLLFSPPKL